MALLRLKRESKWISRFRRFRIVLDGEKIGKIGNGKTFEHTITAGKHALQVGIDWVDSAVVDFECKPGQTIEFECGHAPATTWKVALNPEELVLTLFLNRIDQTAKPQDSSPEK